MNELRQRSFHLHPTLAVVSFILLTPALILCLAGFLQLLFRLDSSSPLLPGILEATLGKILFSPFLVLGGILICLGINLWQVCRFSADYFHETYLLCLSVRRRGGPLLFTVLSLLLMTLWFACAWPENVSTLSR